MSAVADGELRVHSPLWSGPASKAHMSRLLAPLRAPDASVWPAPAHIYGAPKPTESLLHAHCSHAVCGTRFSSYCCSHGVLATKLVLLVANLMGGPVRPPRAAPGRGARDSRTAERDSAPTLMPERAGAPDTIRTCGLHLRRVALYPAELRVHSSLA